MALRRRDEALATWVITYGADLKPPGADSFGEGVRCAKEAVRYILLNPEAAAREHDAAVRAQAFEEPGK